MLKNKNMNNRIVEIICPNHFNNALQKAGPFFELFIKSLLECEQAETTLKINIRNKYVECNNMKVKDTLALILKAGKLNDFCAQVKSFFHKPELNCQNSTRILKVNYNGSKLYFEIKEETNNPGLAWVISKRESE